MGSKLNVPDLPETPPPPPPPPREETRVALARRGLAINTMDELWAVAKRIAGTAFAPDDFFEKPEACFVAMLQLREVGLPEITSLRDLAVINGKVTVHSDSFRAIIIGSGLCEDINEYFEGEPYDDDYAAVCEIKRAGVDRPTVGRFSVAQAKTAKLWMKKTYKGKDTPWVTYPDRMLHWRALGFAGRDAFPDVLRGIWLREEAMDMEPEPQDDRRDVTPKEPPKDTARDKARDKARATLKTVCLQKYFAEADVLAMAQDKFGAGLSELTEAQLTELTVVIMDMADTKPEREPERAEPAPEPPTDDEPIGPVMEEIHAIAEHVGQKEWVALLTDMRSTKVISCFDSDGWDTETAARLLTMLKSKAHIRAFCDERAAGGEQGELV